MFDFIFQIVQYYQSAELLLLRIEMGRDVNDDRRRALVRGKFKFLYQDDTEDLEATDKFNLAVVQNKLLGDGQRSPLIINLLSRSSQVC